MRYLGADHGGFTIRYRQHGSPILNDPRILEALGEVLKDRAMRVRVNDVGAYAVTFHYLVNDERDATDANEAEWGAGRTVTEALRYALAAALGCNDMVDVASRIGDFDADHRTEPEELEEGWTA